MMQRSRIGPDGHEGESSTNVVLCVFGSAEDSACFALLVAGFQDAIDRVLQLWMIELFRAAQIEAEVKRPDENDIDSLDGDDFLDVLDSLSGFDLNDCQRFTQDFPMIGGGIQAKLGSDG